MTNTTHDVGSVGRDRPAKIKLTPEIEAAKAKIAVVFEPYLDAVLSETLSDDLEFDRDVTNSKDLALFLAGKAVEILGQKAP